MNNSSYQSNIRRKDNATDNILRVMLEGALSFNDEESELGRKYLLKRGINLAPYPDSLLFNPSTIYRDDEQNECKRSLKPLLTV